jgi:hypothetical protein
MDNSINPHFTPINFNRIYNDIIDEIQTPTAETIFLLDSLRNSISKVVRVTTKIITSSLNEILYCSVELSFGNIFLIYKKRKSLNLWQKTTFTFTATVGCFYAVYLWSTFHLFLAFSFSFLLKILLNKNLSSKSIRSLIIKDLFNTNNRLDKNKPSPQWTLFPFTSLKNTIYNKHISIQEKIFLIPLAFLHNFFIENIENLLYDNFDVLLRHQKNQSIIQLTIKFVSVVYGFVYTFTATVATILLVNFIPNTIALYILLIMLAKNVDSIIYGYYNPSYVINTRIDATPSSMEELETNQIEEID